MDENPEKFTDSHGCDESSSRPEEGHQPESISTKSDARNVTAEEPPPKKKKTKITTVKSKAKGGKKVLKQNTKNSEGV